MLVESFPCTSSASALLRMNAANTHLLTPISYHVHFELFFRSQHLVVSLQAEDRISLHLQLVVVSLDLLLCCSLVCAKLGVAVKVGSEVFKDDWVIHEDLLMPARLLWVCRRWYGPDMGGDEGTDRRLDVGPLKMGCEYAKDWCDPNVIYLERGRRRWISTKHQR